MTSDQALPIAPSSTPTWRAFAIIGVAGAVAWVLNFSTFAIFTRTLGPDRFGELNFGLSVAAAFGALLAPNLNVWGARLIAADRTMVSRSLVLVNGVQTGAGVVLFIILGVVYWNTLSPALALQLISCNVMFFAAALGLQWVAQGLQRLDLIAWNQLIAAASSLVLAVLVSHGASGAIRAPLALAAGQIIASAFIFWRLWRAGAFVFEHIDWKVEFSRLRHAVVFGYFSIFGIMNQYAGVIWIKSFGTSQDVALYGVASRTYLTFVLVTAMLSTVFFPRIARRGAHEDGAVRSEVGAWVAIALILGCAPAAVMIGDPHAVIHVLFGEGYAGAELAIRASGLAILFAFANNAYSMSLLARGGDRAFMHAIIVSVCVTVGGGAIGAWLFGLRGVSAILAVTDLVMLVSLLVAFRRRIGETFWRLWLRPLAALALTVVFLLLPVMRDQFFWRLVMASGLYGLIAVPWPRLMRELMGRRA